MAKLLSICENCGLIFPNQMFEIRENIVFEFSGITIIVPCPKCGKEVSTSPQGIFRSINGVIEFLGTSERSLSELRRFYEIVKNARQKKQSVEDFSEVLTKELPELSPISSFLQQHATSAGLLIGLLGLILAATSAIIDVKTYQEAHQQKADVEPKIIINQTYNTFNAPTVNQTYNAPSSRSRKNPAEKPFVKSKRVGVNNPCECGSGRKRKKCHP
jgi:hypothetical protein